MHTVIIEGITLGVIIGTVSLLALAVLPNPLRTWAVARRHRRESVSHPERFCYFCHGTATRLVKSYVEGRYHCKDRELCRQTTELRRSL